MDIKYSRRILVLGAREAGALDIVKDLTGSAPEPGIDGSTAGLTHEWNAETAYYKATVPIWIDEVTSIEDWKIEFLKEEAKEVVEAVGAWIFCFRPEEHAQIGVEVEAFMKTVQEVVQEHTDGYAEDIVKLAVAKPSPKQLTQEKMTSQSGQEEQEDKCMEYGFEYINYIATGTNEYGEKQGFDRLKEALEANEWSAAAGEDDLDLDALGLGEDDDDDISGFGHEEAEMTAELFGMKAALNNRADEELGFEDFEPPERQADQVEDLNRMIGKLVAIKEQSAGLPEEQRKRMAAKAVRELMDENPNI